MGLRSYCRSGYFSKTPESRGRQGSGKGEGVSVIPQHATNRLHSDFRLELDGTSKSLAVPKGPSREPTQERLAVQVEDYPLDYAQFEGLIPTGQYGGGRVLLWDCGRWTPLDDPGEALQRERLKFTLQGDKLSGAWTLIRMGRARDRRKEHWLLMKERNEYARLGGKAEVTRRRLRAIERRSSPVQSVLATALRARIHWAEPRLVADSLPALIGLVRLGGLELHT